MVAISLARWARLCELLALWAETQQRRSARLRKTFATGRRDCHLIAILIELACGQSPRQDSLVRGSQSPNNVPHACESGTRKTPNNQTHEPTNERDDEECDWIDTLVTRCFSVNDRHQRMAGEDYPCQDANYRHSAAWLGSPALFAVVLNGRNAVPLGRDFILCVKVRFDNIAFFNFEHDYRLRLTCRLIVTAHRYVNTPSKPISV